MTGMKAGAVAGAAYGLIIALIAYVTLILLKEDIMLGIIAVLPPDSPLTAQQVYDLTLLFEPIFSFIVGIILGVIFGIVYGWAHDKIPGRTYLNKGIVFGLILWLIFSVILSFVLSLMLGLGNLQYDIVYYLYGLGRDLIIYLIFGLLLGFFYNRFTPRLLADQA